MTTDDPSTVETVATALRANRIEAIVVDTGDEARDTVLSLIPEGAEVHSGKSRTLEDVGLYAELMDSGRYGAVRSKTFVMEPRHAGS